MFPLMKIIPDRAATRLTMLGGEQGDLCPPPLPLCVERGLNTPTLTIPYWLVSLGFEICLLESKSHHHGFFQFIGDIW